jgi:threonine dehydratase
VVVPVGGGGLISGVAFAIKSLNPNCKVYGVQASGAASMVHALQTHEKTALPTVSTIADGIAVKKPGDLTYEMCGKYVDDIVTVTDDEISTAILTLIEQQKLITEGAGAVSVAAVLFDKVPVKGKKVICLLSGGNIDVTILNRVITRGLLKAGRSADITIELSDKPGQLSGVSRIVAEQGGNVVAVYHDRADLNMDINACYLRLVLETRDHAHVAAIENALTQAGYKLVQKQ